MTFGRLLLVAFISTSLINSMARAERVGYQFTGTLEVPLGGTPTWFGAPLTTSRPLTGTFAYDTTTAGDNGAPGERIYHQSISGGYSLDVAFENSHIEVEADEYDVVVRNNYKSGGPNAPPVDEFAISYLYYTQYNMTPKRLRVNGTEWSGNTAIMQFSLTWDQGTFPGPGDPDPTEPKLTADRPATANAGLDGYSGSSSLVPHIHVTGVTAIEPLAGDYNRNGKIDQNDYIEWRKAFGHSEPPFLYADGNHDGIVDGADYTVWRKAMGRSSPLAATIPEPGSLSAVIWLVLLVWSKARWQRGARQH